MTFEIVTHTPISIPDLFALKNDPHRVTSLAVLDDHVIEIPAHVTLVAERRLQISVFAASVTLELTGLANVEMIASGFGRLSARDRHHGRRFLEGLARVTNHSVAAQTVRGPIQPIDVGVMAVPRDGGVVIQMKAQHQHEPMRFGIWFSLDGRPGKLLLGRREIRDSFVGFAALWTAAACEGVAPPIPPRRDPLFASDMPWITTATLVWSAARTDWSKAAFGGEVMFAFADVDEDTYVFVWDHVGAKPRVLVAFEHGRLSLSPSPDGRWLVIQREVSDDAATLYLVSVADGEIRELCASPSAIEFDITRTVEWSRDSQRFAFACMRGEVPIVLVYDNEARAFIDALEIDARIEGWAGADVELRGEREFFTWTPGTDALRTSARPPLRSKDQRYSMQWAKGVLDIGVAGGARRTVAIDDPYAFTMGPWANTMLVDTKNDGRVFDMATGTWRFLAPLEWGEPYCFSPHGRVVVFAGDKLRAGVADMPPIVMPPVDWSEPALRGVALASALANDFDEVDIALRRMDVQTRAQTQPLVDEIMAAHEAARGDTDDN